MRTRFHLPPAGVLRVLDRVGIFVDLQPEAEPVQVSFVHGQLVLGLEFFMRLVGEYAEVGAVGADQGNLIVQRVQVLLF